MSFDPKPWPSGPKFNEEQRIYNQPIIRPNLQPQNPILQPSINRAQDLLRTSYTPPVYYKP